MTGTFLGGVEVIPERRGLAGSRHSSLLRKTTMVSLVAGLAAAGLWGLGLVTEPSGQLLVSCFVAFALGALLFAAVVALRPDLLIPRLIVASFVLQIPWVILAALIDPPVVMYASLFGPALADYPARSLFPLLLVPVGVLLFMLPAAVFGVRRNRRYSLEPGDGSVPRNMELYLNIAAVLLLLYWFGSLPNSGMAGYLVRVLGHSTLLVPFIAARHARALPNVRRVWVATMAVNAVIGLAVGSRMVALWPIVTFAVGYITTLRAREQTRAILVAGIMAIPAILITGLVGIVRDGASTTSGVRTGIGRGGLEVLNVDRLSTVLDEAVDIGSSEALGPLSIAAAGVQRQLVATNYVVPILSPETVPFRGFSDIGEELSKLAEIAVLTGSSRKEWLERGLGTVQAVAYGFTVNEGTSVEFGILADAWSRGGAWAVIAFGAIMTLVLVLAEKTTWGLFVANRAAVSILLCVLAQTALLNMNSSGLLSTIRSLVLNWMFLAMCLVVANQLTRGDPVQVLRRSR